MTKQSGQVSVLLIVGMLCAVALWAAPAWGGDAPPDTWRPLAAAVHVHSTASTGTLSVEQLAGLAEQRGLDAIILSDNFVLHYEYGLFPFRQALRRTVSWPSVIDYGIERYFEDVAEAQRRHPGVLLLPGFEMAPHYYWTGSLWTRDLTMHDAQKNLLVFGLARAEEVRDLPVNGNCQSDRYGWETALGAIPAFLFIPAVWFWRLKTHRTIRVGVVSYRVTRRYHVPALLLAAVAGALLINAWPFSQARFSQYDESLAYGPHQALIDTVRSRGGATLWSMPEARDFNVFSYGPLGNVTVKTEPYPDALLKTADYTGFGGLYEDTRMATQPGGPWDQAIAQYLAGQRRTAPLVFGEIAYHGPGGDQKALDQILTVFWVRERTAAGVLEAVRAGRFYATYAHQRDYGLRLDALQLEDETGARVAGVGDTFLRPDAREIVVRVAVSATDRAVHPVTVAVIRSGQVIARVTGETPFAQRIVDRLLPSGAQAAYRVEVTGQGEVLSNPMFVKGG